MHSANLVINNHVNRDSKPVAKNCAKIARIIEAELRLHLDVSHVEDGYLVVAFNVQGPRLLIHHPKGILHVHLDWFYTELYFDDVPVIVQQIVDLYKGF